MYRGAVTDDLDEARALLPGMTLSPLDVLGGSSRSSVRRARVTQAGGLSTTVIVKTFHQPTGWVRESAALAALPSHTPAPRLLAARSSPPVVIMSDLGQGPSVADALLGADPAAATWAVFAWVDALANVHVTTSGLRDRFRAELEERAQPGWMPLSALIARFDTALGELRDACEPLGISVPDTLAEALRGGVARLDNEAASALSPSDVCPDNNVFIGDVLALIDFEGAEWRHVAWDVAYLRVPWPSCWCSWRLPDELSERAIDRYREAMAEHMPYVATSDFDRDLAAATDLWSVLYSSWLLPLTLAEEPAADRHGIVSPQRRALVLHRLDLARRTSVVAAIAAFADELHKALVDRWGEVPLALAPAFH